MGEIKDPFGKIISKINFNCTNGLDALFAIGPWRGFHQGPAPHEAKGSVLSVRDFLGWAPQMPSSSQRGPEPQRMENHSTSQELLLLLVGNCQRYPTPPKHWPALPPASLSINLIGSSQGSLWRALCPSLQMMETQWSSMHKGLLESECEVLAPEILAQARPVRTDSFHWNFPNPMASTASSTMKVSGKEAGGGEKRVRASCSCSGVEWGWRGPQANSLKAAHAASRTYPRKAFWQVWKDTLLSNPLQHYLQNGKRESAECLPTGVGRINNDICYNFTCLYIHIVKYAPTVKKNMQM